MFKNIRTSDPVVIPIVLLAGTQNRIVLVIVEGEDGPGLISCASQSWAVAMLMYPALA